MAKHFASAALLLLLACHQAAAWSRTENCYDEVVGASGHFGIVGENKPMEEVDQTDVWKEKGAISKLNLYYSWNYGCLQGIKATYGYKAGDAKIIGHEKNLYTQDIKFADYEHVNKIDIVQQKNKCIEFLKLYTNKGQTLAFGNAKSTSPKETTIAPEGAFLAALKGAHDIVDGKQEGLQNLIFVWAKEVCPTPAPVPKPETPEPTDSTPPTDTPTPAPAPTDEPPVAPPVAPPAPPPEMSCPQMPAMCDEGAAEGSVGYCPVTNPFTAPKCVGGCCVSTGKCKMPLCKFNGLGADVIALDFICYGKNNGPFAGLNKCRNLACKLAVPGCQSGLLGGNCVGTVEAVNDNLDDDAKQYIGMPCLELLNTPGPLHMPLNKPGLPVPNGEYMGGLWSVCDCSATPSPVLPAVPFFDIKKHLLAKKYEFFKSLVDGIAAVASGDKPDCVGPLCALLPQLPVMNATLPDLQIPMTLLANITALLKPKHLDLPALGGIIPQIELPHIEVKTYQLTLPDLPTFEECVGYFVNITNTLKPAIEAVFPQPGLSLSMPDCVQIVADLLPEIKFQLPQFDITNMPKLELPDLKGLVSALLPKIPQFPQLQLNIPGLKLPKLTGGINFTVPKFEMPKFEMPGNFSIEFKKPEKSDADVGVAAVADAARAEPVAAADGAAPAEPSAVAAGAADAAPAQGAVEVAADAAPADVAPADAAPADAVN